MGTCAQFAGLACGASLRIVITLNVDVRVTRAIVGLIA